MENTELNKNETVNEFKSEISKGIQTDQTTAAVNAVKAAPEKKTIPQIIFGSAI